MALSDSPTIAKLADWIIRQLRGEAPANADTTLYEIRAQIEKVAAQHADEVPVADIERMASQLNAGSGAVAQRMIQ
jgi:hypothetical protein